MENGVHQVVDFELASENYGVAISDVHEIIRMVDVTKIPKAKQFIEGVINLRGRIIPIIDLRKRFGLESKAAGQDKRIIVVRVEDQTVGMIVDAVSEVLQISPSQIEGVSSLVSSQVDTEFISGIAKVDNRLIILLDLGKVLTAKERSELKNFEPELKMLGQGEEDG